MPSVTSVAVKVVAPPVSGVTEKVRLPATSAALGGRTAAASDDVMAMVWVDETGFQWASTDMTVMLKAACAVWVDGVPVRPVGEPGAAVSPGTMTSSRSNGPALTVMLPLVPVFEDPATLTVCVPAVLSVAPPVNVRVPASAGRNVYTSGENAA